MATLYEKLDQIEVRYVELTAQISSPEVLADSARFQKLAKTHAEMGEIVAKYREWKQVDKGLHEAKLMAAESEEQELRQMAHDEEKQLAGRKDTIEHELKLLLLPKDPNDEKSIILEIRAGTGGTKRVSSPANSSACTHGMPRRRDGKWKCSRVRRLRSAA